MNEHNTTRNYSSSLHLKWMQKLELEAGGEVKCVPQGHLYPVGEDSSYSDICTNRRKKFKQSQVTKKELASFLKNRNHGGTEVCEMREHYPLLFFQDHTSKQREESKVTPHVKWRIQNACISTKKKNNASLSSSNIQKSRSAKELSTVLQLKSL